MNSALQGRKIDDEESSITDSTKSKKKKNSNKKNNMKENGITKEIEHSNDNKTKGYNTLMIDIICIK